MFSVNDEPEGKFLYTETIKLYCIVLFPPTSSGTISWTPDSTDRLRAYALYQQDGGSNQFRLVQLLSRDTHSVKVGQGRYALSAVDRLARESPAQIVVVDSTLVG